MWLLNIRTWLFKNRRVEKAHEIGDVKNQQKIKYYLHWKQTQN